MPQPVNPYVAGGPVQDEEGFFGRQATLEWVARGLRNPASSSLVLFGQRRIGKTTLLLQLRRTLPTDAFLPIYFDLQGQATRPVGHVLADLADAIAEQAGLEAPDPEVFDDRGLFFSRTFLPRICDVLGKDRRPVILFDEFEVLDPTAKKELPTTAAIHSLLRLIRRVMTSVSSPAFVFTIGRRVEDLVLDYTANFKASLVREVWVLAPENAEAMIRQAEANRTLHFTDQAVNRILSLTHGHPYLTQLLCRQIWEQAYEQRPTALPQIGVPEVEAAVPSALESVDQALDWLWGGLSLAEQIYAAGLAEAIDEGKTIKEEQGMQVLLNHAARLLTREVELMAPRDLVRRRVLDMVGEREYRFAVELFRRWIRQHKPLKEVKAKLDRVDPLADELFGIGQEFFRRNQWKAAVRYFRDALAANPKHFHARLRLGEALLQLGQVKRAVEELEWSYKQDQEEARALLTRALVAQARTRKEAEDEQGALAACERVLKISPGHRAAQQIHDRILINRLEREARKLVQAERWARAAAIYEKLVNQSSEDEDQKRWEAALKHCRREDRLARLFSEGTDALEEKNWKRAQEAFAEIVHIRPDYSTDKKLAARLLQQAVLKKPTRRYARLLSIILIPALLMLVAATWYFRPWQEVEVMPPVQLPTRWEHVHTYRLDTNYDAEDEWVVLYRFDLPTGTESGFGPIGGVVYHSDDKSSSLIRYELRPPDGDYLCECECVAAMEETLSGISGPELVLRDQCQDETARLSIFHWDPDKGTYASKGHFSGSQIQVDLDSVTVNQRLPHRAQLVLKQIYQPRADETYYQPGELGITVMPAKYELTFYKAEPKDVMRSPYPEKVVLSFYHHYDDRRDLSQYFTEQGWERLDHCHNGQCGCPLSPGEHSHVRVTNLQSGESTLSDTNYADTNWAIFYFNVICESGQGTPEGEIPVKWRLVRQGDQWKLDDAEVLPVD